MCPRCPSNCTMGSRGPPSASPHSTPRACGRAASRSCWRAPRPSACPGRRTRRAGGPRRQAAPWLRPAGLDRRPRHDRRRRGRGRAARSTGTVCRAPSPARTTASPWWAPHSHWPAAPGRDAPATFPLPARGWRGEAMAQLLSVTWPLPIWSCPATTSNYALPTTARSRSRSCSSSSPRVTASGGRARQPRPARELGGSLVRPEPGGPDGSTNRGRPAAASSTRRRPGRRGCAPDRAGRRPAGEGLGRQSRSGRCPGSPVHQLHAGGREGQHEGPLGGSGVHVDGPVPPAGAAAEATMRPRVDDQRGLTSDSRAPGPGRLRCPRCERHAR